MIESIESSGAAQQGIKSFPSLAAWFSTTLAPKIQSVSLVPAEHQAGVLSHIASAGLSKLLFRRKAGWVEGDDVSAVLARAEYLLSEKDLDGAARQVNQLKGWAGKLAGDWLREARKRLEVEQALGVSLHCTVFAPPRLTSFCSDTSYRLSPLKLHCPAYFWCRELAPPKESNSEENIEIWAE
jgi:hypothetical protein